MDKTRQVYQGTMIVMSANVLDALCTHTTVQLRPQRATDLHREHVSRKSSTAIANFPETHSRGSLRYDVG